MEDGKGKDDLTAALIEPVKANQISSSRQEISTDGSCSNLFAEDNIKLLTGDSELWRSQEDDFYRETVKPSRIQKTVTLPLHDGSDRSQNV